jgi:hypothetical protein
MAGPTPNPEWSAKRIVLLKCDRGVRRLPPVAYCVRVPQVPGKVSVDVPVLAVPVKM